MECCDLEMFGVLVVFLGDDGMLFQNRDGMMKARDTEVGGLRSLSA